MLKYIPLLKPVFYSPPFFPPVFISNWPKNESEKCNLSPRKSESSWWSWKKSHYESPVICAPPVGLCLIHKTLLRHRHRTAIEEPTANVISTDASAVVIFIQCDSACLHYLYLSKYNKKMSEVMKNCVWFVNSRKLYAPTQILFDLFPSLKLKCHFSQCKNSKN